jgi:hypothetical protein
MLNYTDLILDSAMETQLKLKMIQSSKSIIYKDSFSSLSIKKNLLRTFLKILYSINLKKVLSGKHTNRIILNYFKKFLLNLDNIHLNSNKNTLDLNYSSTLVLNSFYEICSEEFEMN